ncbi:calcium/proton exchanger [Haloimpatiens lingqiaonensis]|uniref:calcium/proton exchanger n=1 Tax=Haloimpatiens lingqiaonensis TaxID=1380675 RepID=UPI0010FE8C71|nr:calcium/proton exchanger [Haloimpatiens lingqiaonensis]
MEKNKKVIIAVSLVVLLILLNTPYYIINIISSCMLVVILAVLLGDVTSNMSTYLGEKKGGMLAATIGNIPELMMGIWSVKYGMIPMAKAALLGSIISNMLLGLGIAVIVGGLKYREQRFNKIIARTNFNMLILAMSAIIIISALNRYTIYPLGKEALKSISVKVSLVLIFVYLLGLIFSFCTHKNLFLVDGEEVEEEERVENKLKLFLTVIKLIFIAVMLYFISEKLIFNVKTLVETKKVSQEFLGIILIPLLGNIGENVTTVMCALDNKINMSIETAIGSSIQISLFVTPLLTILSCVLLEPLTLVFSSFEIIISVLAIGMSFLVFQDGKSYWFEGAILGAVYIIITLAYYYIR